MNHNIIRFNYFSDFTSGSSIYIKISQSLFMWMARRRQRLALGKLDDRLLKDIGCSRSEALEEANKPFWVE